MSTLASENHHDTIELSAAWIVVPPTLLVVALSEATQADRSSLAQSSRTNSIVQASREAVQAEVLGVTVEEPVWSWEGTSQVQPQ